MSTMSVRAWCCVVAVMLCAGCSSGFTYEESAHYDAVVKAEGHAPKDWPKYRKVAEDLCHSDKQTFALTMAMFADKNDWGFIDTTVKYVCPDRTDELVGLKLR